MEILEATITEHLGCSAVKDVCGCGRGRERLEVCPDRLGLGEFLCHSLHLPQGGVEL